MLSKLLLVLEVGEKMAHWLYLATGMVKLMEPLQLQIATSGAEGHQLAGAGNGLTSVYEAAFVIYVGIHIAKAIAGKWKK